MKIVDFEQGSAEWLNWRRSLLTATDAAVLLGHSPYVTRFQGWQRKLGLIPEQAMNSAMQRGRDDEPIARQMFIEQYGINMTPVCIESEIYNYLGASLDGLSDCKRFILEVKSQNIQRIKDFGIPEMHMDQMQHAMMATDGYAQRCYYVSIWNKEIYVLEVDASGAWKEFYLPEAKKYWECIVFREAPELTRKDYREIDDSEWSNFATEFRRVSEQIKQLEEVKESYRKELIRICDNQSSMGAGIKVCKKYVKGRVNYAKIPELKELNLDQYRGETTESWMIMLDKKET